MPLKCAAYCDHGILLQYVYSDNRSVPRFFLQSMHESHFEPKCTDWNGCGRKNVMVIALIGYHHLGCSARLAVFVYVNWWLDAFGVHTGAVYCQIEASIVREPSFMYGSMDTFSYAICSCETKTGEWCVFCVYFKVLERIATYSVKCISKDKTKSMKTAPFIWSRNFGMFALNKHRFENRSDTGNSFSTYVLKWLFTIKIGQ